MRNLAIIPARGGSKRIQKKNIKKFLGTPMLELTIKKLVSCDIFDKIVVSTDDHEISKIAQDQGAEVPFLRSSHLAEDNVPTAPVIADMLAKYTNDKFDYCCCVYSCTPLLEIEDFTLSFDFFIKQEASFCYTVAEFPHPTQRALRIKDNGRLQFVQPEHELTPTQNLERLLHDCGQFYWGKSKSWLGGAKMHSYNAVGYELPSWKAIDIDTEEDWSRAELMFEVINNE